MNILVCIKQVVDSSMSLAIDTTTSDICYDDVAWVPNPADLAAIQMASSIRDHLGEGQVIALSIGPQRVHSALRKSLALGADRGVRLDAQAAIAAEAVVFLLAAATKQLECSLVLCGNQAMDTLSGYTGIALSVALEWPIVSLVTQFVDIEKQRSLVLQRRVDGGRHEVVQVDFPAVLTCELGSSELHYPSLPLLMKSVTTPIAVLTPRDIGVSASTLSREARVKAVGISPPRPRPKKIFTPDSDLAATERIKQIMSGGLAQRHSDILEGTSREVAVALVNQLRQRKLV
jgi:electron transfer flavoprotein beta subunit